MTKSPLLLLTMGDVAGIGPEIIARAWPDLHALCQPVVVGDAGWMRQALRLTASSAEVQLLTKLGESRSTPNVVPVLQASKVKLDGVVPGKVSAAAGQAAYDFLCRAIDETLAGRAAGIVTLPLHKEGLHAAGVPHPGHTEILAERTGTQHFGMMLYARGPKLPHGLGVVHVTLHMALHDIFRHITTSAVLEKIRLLDDMMKRLCGRQPRLGVAALNPHASDGGLFGDEEVRLIVPAVQTAQAEGIAVSGPWPSDTLFVRAAGSEFDGIVAMYHDQGHIALKLLGGLHAVNVTVGLPLVRTSVAHGTAYDIVGKGIADPTSLIEAVRVAALLCNGLEQAV
ncbi:MAG TPA: 4-hydroxythreonine-4-phosphate dehydrogenase PdxA [Gemmataceae bacterium]|nr:4-hydroxythreonine-4-phosphate dehydrogenase PdxA [Gemmataceae bacterium]